jgi:hypothetical protein
MKLKHYKKLLPNIGRKMKAAGTRFTCYMHDNIWRGAEPTDELNKYVGKDKWTKYMGKPCWRPHERWLTPKTKKPVKVAKLRCDCEFPPGPVHAAYSPKTNLVEQTSARIDRQMTANKIADKQIGMDWPDKGGGKSTFWKMQLDRAIREVNEDKDYFKRQYKTFKKICRAHVQSNGKRLKTSKW